jgi:hypothetical protein
VQVWRNVGAGTADRPVPMGNWLAVDLEQDGTNRDAVGAWVAVRTGRSEIEREATVGGGHASGASVPMHFGLGAADRAEIRVTWPDGEVGPWIPADAGRTITVQRAGPDIESASR